MANTQYTSALAKWTKIADQNEAGSGLGAGTWKGTSREDFIKKGMNTDVGDISEGTPDAAPGVTNTPQPPPTAAQTPASPAPSPTPQGAPSPMASLQAAAAPGAGWAQSAAQSQTRPGLGASSMSPMQRLFSGRAY